VQYPAVILLDDQVRPVSYRDVAWLLCGFRNDV